MFFGTYQISRELTERLLHELYHPCREEIIENNRALEETRAKMHITKLSNGAAVDFDDLDLSFLDKPHYLGNTSEGAVQINWQNDCSDISETQFLLGNSSFLAA